MNMYVLGEFRVSNVYQSIDTVFKDKAVAESYLRKCKIHLT